MAAQVNTERFTYLNIGMLHQDGGWPKDVDPTEKDQTLCVPLRHHCAVLGAPPRAPRPRLTLPPCPSLPPPRPATTAALCPPLLGTVVASCRGLPPVS